MADRVVGASVSDKVLDCVLGWFDPRFWFLVVSCGAVFQVRSFWFVVAGVFFFFLGLGLVLLTCPGESFLRLGFLP